MTSHSFFGLLQLKYSYNGVWELKGDSLILKYDPGMEYEVDTTGISYKPDMKESLSNVLAEVEEAFKQMKKKNAAEGVHKDAYAVSIDTSLDKIEMRSEEKDDDGMMQTVFKYLLRKNEESEK